ncbi:MAG: hypothetical protein ACLP5H_10315 [Desulfomonilaceae bacterium]
MTLIPAAECSKELLWIAEALRNPMFQQAGTLGFTRATFSGKDTTS